jgi:hypothetical protein
LGRFWLFLDLGSGAFQVAQDALAELARVAQVLLFPGLEVPDGEPDHRRGALCFPGLQPAAHQERG